MKEEREKMELKIKKKIKKIIGGRERKIVREKEREI